MSNPRKNNFQGTHQLPPSLHSTSLVGSEGVCFRLGFNSLFSRPHCCSCSFSRLMLFNAKAPSYSKLLLNNRQISKERSRPTQPTLNQSCACLPLLLVLLWIFLNLIYGFSHQCFLSDALASLLRLVDALLNLCFKIVSKSAKTKARSNIDNIEQVLTALQSTYNASY